VTKPVSFHGIDHDLIDLAWKKFYPERFWVSPILLRQNLTDHALFDWGCSWVMMRDGVVTSFVACKKSASPHLYSGPDPDLAHITALAFEDPCWRW
jgi:hypothetical protein